MAAKWRPRALAPPVGSAATDRRQRRHRQPRYGSCGPRPLFARQFDSKDGTAERAATVSAVGRTDPTAVVLDYLAYNGETEPGPVGACCEERLKRALQVVLGNARTIVEDLQERAIGGRSLSRLVRMTICPPSPVDWSAFRSRVTRAWRMRSGSSWTVTPEASSWRRRRQRLLRASSATASMAVVTTSLNRIL